MAFLIVLAMLSFVIVAALPLAQQQAGPTVAHQAVDGFRVLAIVACAILIPYYGLKTVVVLLFGRQEEAEPAGEDTGNERGGGSTG